ncbi:hypothetical protein F7R20_27185 [Pseudomonas brassicacearum subsp. brassicacearum]|nr:hypothetical protein F7R20_27185 [Pseudomonas brassicacearum subsp. brassicacearum]
MIVPTLCVGMHPVTLCVASQKRNAERPWRHSHALRGHASRDALRRPLRSGTRSVPGGIPTREREERSFTAPAT